MKVLYSKCNRERKTEFQIQTIIFENNGIKQVKKKPLTKEAVGHIQAIRNNCDLLQQSYSNIRILNGHLENGELIYPYVRGKSLDGILLDLIQRNQKEEFLFRIKQFNDLLNHLQYGRKENFIANESFLEVFGVELQLDDVICLNPANIDLIFDNLFEDAEGNKIILDCEWVFPFRIPVKYILFRSIYAFWVKHQHYIAQLFSFNELCIESGISESLIQPFTEMEENYFQKYVHGEYNGLRAYQKDIYSLDDMKKNYHNQEALQRFNIRTYSENQNESIPTYCSIHEMEYSLDISHVTSVITIKPVDIDAVVEIKYISLDNEKVKLDSTSTQSQIRFENLIILNQTETTLSFVADQETKIEINKLNDINQLNFVMKVTPINAEFFESYKITKTKNKEFEEQYNELQKLRAETLLELNNVQNKLTEAVEALSYHSNEVKLLTDLNDEKLKLLEENEISIQSLENSLKEIYSSKSWKLTKPLRSLMKIIRR
ncbi:hypothetical protein [Paenibacillus aestuarii]|uniref:Uncharacterized protein n=1 Tax=Paenibacillus aestuarii TaxID=516965 RepID=A0ABW0K2S3_9BACL|nr:hypothetical protein [Paenibacillus aestuarii]